MLMEKTRSKDNPCCCSLVSVSGNNTSGEAITLYPASGKCLNPT